MTSAPAGLAKKSMGTASMFWFCVGASSPMTVLAGGIVATYATSGVVGIPLSFIVLAAVLWLFTTGYTAMARHVPHAASFYAVLARGIGRVGGVAGGAVALLAYNCIQISLYGLLGATFADMLGGHWVAWALGAWVIIAVLGLLHVGINAVVLATVLVAEIIVIALFDVGAFLNPAEGAISVAPLMPDSLIADGLGSVIALGIAAFVGYELAPVFGEEARSHRTVTRATFGALLFLGLFYAATAWALAVAVGPNSIVAASRDPDMGIPFSLIEQIYGKGLALLSLMLLVTSIFAAMLSFHNAIGRYVFGLSRDGVLPATLSRVGSRGRRAGAPIGGSIVQSCIALVAIALFGLLDADPVAVLFTWLSTVAALGVMLLMLCASVGVVRFFRRGGGTHENAWSRMIAPGAGAIGLAVILAVTVANVDAITGTDTASPISWLLPAVVVVVAVGGLVWGTALRSQRSTYERIGAGEQEPLAVLEHDLSDLIV